MRRTYLIIPILLLTSCLLPELPEKEVRQEKVESSSSGSRLIELAPGEEVFLYRKVMPLYYTGVVVRASDDYVSENMAKEHARAVKRVSWGIGIILAGTALSAALKAYHFEICGVYLAAIGGGIAVHGVIMAKIAEWWPWVGVGVFLFVCAMVTYFCHGKGAGDFLDKMRSRIKLKE